MVDAYKRNELDKESGLGIFALSAILVDRAEPSEALKANIAWSLGLDDCQYLVSPLQVDNFRKELKKYKYLTDQKEIEHTTEKIEQKIVNNNVFKIKNINFD